MNPPWEHSNGAGARGPIGSGDAQEPPHNLDDTLRLLAGVPIPEGLAERVQDALRKAPREARVLAWPTAARPNAAWLGNSAWLASGWARSAAAAAIVFVVAGGGWGVYTHLPHPAAKVIVMPAHGFSSAGAIRRPQAIDRPVMAGATAVAAPNSESKTAPVTMKPGKRHHHKLKTAKTAAAATGAGPAATSQPTSASQPAAPSSVAVPAAR